MSNVRTAISPEQVQKTMSIVISTLKFVSTIIPGEADDRIVDVVSKLAQESWIIPAITFLINKFDGDLSQIKAEDFILAVRNVQDKQ